MRKDTASLFLRHVAAGAVICAGAIIPGVSGGVVAMSLGLYEPIAHAVYGLVKEFKKSFRFLLPIGIGGVIGTLGMASALTYLMAHFETPVLLAFMGLVLGGLPGIVREGNAGGFRPRYLLASLGGIVFFTVLGLADRFFGVTTAAEQGLSFAESLAAGVIAALGTIIPGVSTSFLLMLLHWYEPFMNAIAGLDLGILIPGALGFALTAVAVLRLVNYVFSRARAASYYAVAGFTSGSAVFLLARVLSSGVAWWHPLFLIAGAAAGYLVSASLKKNPQKG